MWTKKTKKKTKKNKHYNTNDTVIGFDMSCKLAPYAKIKKRFCLPSPDQLGKMEPTEKILLPFLSAFFFFSFFVQSKFCFLRTFPKLNLSFE